MNGVSGKPNNIEVEAYDIKTMPSYYFDAKQTDNYTKPSNTDAETSAIGTKIIDDGTKKSNTDTKTSDIDTKQLDYYAEKFDGYTE